MVSAAHRLPFTDQLHFDSIPMLRRFLGYTVVILTATACSRDDTASAHPRDEARSAAGRVVPRPAVITPASQPYRVVQVGTPGSITGTFDFEGPIPADTVIRPNVDQAVCGNSIVEKRITRSGGGTRVGGVLVWLTDIRSGKPLPLERRFELTNDDCKLDPYIQVIFTNSTLNVATEDRTLHTNRFINVGTGEVAAIAPFNDNGEVVPLDHTFKEPGQIEVVCEQHPWTKAWIAVLDHPYSAKTSALGTFNIDAIPPGRYRVRAWHPSLGVEDDSVTVAAGQSTTLAFRMRRAGTPAPAPIQVPVDTQPPAASSTPPGTIPPAASSTPTSSSTTREVRPR